MACSEARHCLTMAAWIPLNYLVVKNEEHPIPDVLDVLIGKKYIRPDQVNKEAMLLVDINCPEVTFDLVFPSIFLQEFFW